MYTVNVQLEVYVLVVGYARGNPYKLLYPTDSSGNICGYDTGYT